MFIRQTIKNSSTLLLISSLFILELNSVCLAQDAVGGNQAGAMAVSPYNFIFQTVQFFLFAFFIYYMLVLRPQQLNEEEHARFIKDLKKDDEVQISNGILGKVVAIAEDFVTVEIASGVKVRVLKSNVKAQKKKDSVKK